MKPNLITKDYLENKTSGYVSKDQKSDDLNNYLRLDLGENLIGNANVSNMLKSITQNELSYYSDPSNSDIKKTIASLYCLDANNITIANSSNELIDTIPRMFIKEGDKSLIITPTFYRFIDASQKAGAVIEEIKLNQKNNFKFDTQIINKICKKIEKDKINIVWICNPNNPTGEIYNIKDIERIVKDSSSLIIIDEAFYEFYDPSNKNSAVNLINKYHNLIVIRTLSKAYGLAGLRFGYAIANHTLIETIENYQDTLLMTSNLIVNLSQAALMDQVFIQKTSAETKKLKNILFAKIKKLKNIQIGADTKTNIYLLKHKSKDLYKELLQKKILTADFRQCKGIENMGYVRATIGNEEKNKKLLKALKEIN